ncbi:MAG: hypothetical protein CMJ18_12435 [Phycisphaeraceae bacterium]|nr:hypothetical protein [Phycisphaeraceae bacterium]
MSVRFEWVRRARVFMMDNYHPPFWPDLEFDARRLVEVARRYHANVIRFGSAGKWSVFPNEFWPPHPQLGSRDLVDEVLTEAHAHGMKVITYIPTGHIVPDVNIRVHHPEWLYRPAPGAEPPLHLHHGGGLHSPPCLSTPYHDAYLGFAEQLVTEHEIDGIYTDSGVPYHSHCGKEGSLCYCDYCLEKFRQRFGCPMPYAPDPDTLPDSDREMLEAWSLSVGRLMVDVLIEGARLAGERGIPVLTHGCSMAGWPELRFMKEADGILYEAGGTFLHRLEAASLGESSGLATWQYVGGLTPWSRLQWFGRELVEQAVASFASGGAVNVACGVNMVYGAPSHFHQELADLFSTFETHEALFDELHPTRFAAIPFILPMRIYERLQSHRFRAQPVDVRDRSPDLIMDCPINNPSQQHCIEGGFSLMTANHLPVQLVDQDSLSDPEKLARYPLLYLPNIGHLTEDEAACVTDYVHAGGRLLASYRTSLYGPGPDDLLDDFTLSELLGVERIDCDPQRLEDYHQHLWYAGTFDMYARSVEDGWLARGFSEPIWPVNRFEFVRARPGTDVVANIVFGGREDEPLWPAVTSREAGKGRVVYLAATAEQLHREYQMLMIRDLVGAIVDWLCPEGRPLRLEGPDQLLAIPNEKPGTNVLFLVNHTGERMEGMAQIWPRLDRQFTYVAPVPDVRLRWRIAPPKRLWDVVTGQDVAFTVEGDMLSVDLASVGQYAIMAATS